ncbi:MAG: serine/threonine-protein kinase [Acidobacteriota bacterium]
MADRSVDPEAFDLQLGQLLSDALEVPADARRAALESACDDPALIEEALRLLAFDADSDATFLDAPAARILDLGSEPRADEPHRTSRPRPTTRPTPALSRFGPYTVLDELGEGGMGTVYRAIQHQPVERQVAIKVLSRAVPSPEARRRFDLERQALSRLTHPNIARLYEAGATDAGRPFVVMELVEGLPITRFCDLHMLSIDARLRLFVDLCRGIQHAHQKQILHRDLKPANILITTVDDEPVAKIIDFGIARALDRPTDHTFATGDRLVGTPHYMSPEALKPADHRGLDTRADVYSLGVVLFELVVGARPFETPANDLPQLMHEMFDQEPRRPSARLAALDDTTRYQLASHRGLDPEAHRATLRGDLDWIVHKAMAREPERRYGSATELGDEIERVLGHLPIEARPPTPFYRAGKWARRHRAGATLGAVAVCGLIVAMLLTGLSLRRAQRAEAQSRLDAEMSRQTLSFVLDLFDTVRPDGAVRQDASVRDLLREGAAGLQNSDLPPLAKAEILDTLGEVHQRLGLYPTARELLQESLSIRDREQSPTAPDTLRSARLLGNLERRAGRPEAAEPLLLRVLAGAEARAETRADDAPLALADALGSLGNLRWSQNRLDDALALHQRALELRRRHLGSDDEAVAVSHNNLGTLFYSASDFKAAEPHVRRAHAIFAARLGPRHPRVATALGNLVLVLQHLGALDEAERHQRRILEIHRDAFGDDHPTTATAMHNLAGVLVHRGRLGEAEGLYEAALDRRRQRLGSDHPETLRSRTALGRWAWRAGDTERAERLLAETLARREANGDGESAAAYRLRRYLAQVRRDAGAPAEARDALATVLAWQETHLADDGMDVARTLLDLAIAAQRLGSEGEAEQHVRRSLAIQRRDGLRNLHLADTLFTLGELLDARRAVDEADRSFAEALALRRDLLPADHPDRLRSEGVASRRR